MKIDIVSDTVCPWCFVGKRRLEKAMALRPDVAFEVRWRPYQLDASVPPDGIERKAYMRAKFGDNPRIGAMTQSLRQIGADEGIQFDFEAASKRPNTIDSHRLIRWAEAEGVQDKIVELLFKAYFEEGRDIGSAEELGSIAALAGMDRDAVIRRLRGDQDVAAIEQEDMDAHDHGLTGVPTFIFENKFMISGAQEPAMLLKLIDRVAG